MYNRRTPSLTENLTIMQSIERSDTAYNSPAMRQNPFDGYYPVPQQSERRIPEPSRNLIDLTDKAEQAEQRMRMSLSPPPSPYLRRTNNSNRDVDMTDANVPPRPRQLIDLSHQIPTLVSGPSRTDFPQHHSSRPHDQYMLSPRAPMQQEYLPPRHHYQDMQYYSREPAPLPERRVVYEPINESQPTMRSVKYVAEDPTLASYGTRGDQRYFLPDDYPEQRQPPPLQASYPVARQGVYSSTMPMDDVQNTSDSR